MFETFILSMPDKKTQSTGKRTRIVLVDDHQIVRQGVHALLTSARPHWEICAEAGNGEEAIEAVKKFKPEAVVLDITLPILSGFAIAKLIKEIGLETRIVMFSMHKSAAFIVEARKSGADGYVLKTDASLELVKAIESVLSGSTFFPQPS